MNRRGPKRVRRVARRGAAALAYCLSAAAPACAAADMRVPSHADEITTFATAVAVALLASARCPDILVPSDDFASLRAALHVVPADEMAVGIEVRGRVKLFADDLAASPSPQAWCDKAYAFFGPDGTLMRGLLKRQ